MKRLLPLLLLWLPAIAHADPARDEARAQALFAEVRCVQCQSESIADSDAAIAADMRREVRRDIARGMSDTQIRTSLYNHYGDYVLFRPRLTKSNLLLWGLPPLVAIIGIFLLVMRRKSSDISNAAELSPEERKKLQEILKMRD